MSWSQWPGAPAQQPPVVAAAAPLLGTAPGVMPPGMPYTSDQWTQMQQQNWQQWAQWQQQYQQWHQQYGAEYQKSINALAAQQTVPPAMGVPPPLPAEPQPPLPKEEGPKPAPPLPVPVPPPQQSAMPSYSTQPPMHGQFSAPPPNFVAAAAQQPWNGSANLDQKRPLQGSDESTSKRQMTNRQGWQNTSAAPPLPNQNEELSEAEKKFDKQFAEWEAQFNKWKEQNSGHPDKQQYKEYEKKWEQWRQQLLDRREAMRRKRLGLPPGKAGPAPTQNFNVPPPSQTQSAQPPLTASAQHLAPSGVTPPKDSSLPTPNMFNKPPPDMNNEPLQFKSNDKEPEVEEEGLGFLTSSKSEGIPGLDLVKDGDVEDDIVDDEPVQKVPDLEAISKGINNILGDQKLMSMLSMVSQNQGSNLNNYSKMADVSSSRDQSNLSAEDSRNNHPEPIQNFDDQTRSSFTMQPNDPEYYRGSMNNSQVGRAGGQPASYNDNESPYSRPPPNFAMPSQDDLKRPPPSRFGNDQAPFPQRNEQASFPQRNEHGSFPQRNEHGSFPQRNEQGSFPQRNEQAPFPQRNPGGFDRAPPLSQDRRGTGLLPDPERPGGFGGPGEMGRRGTGLLPDPKRQGGFGQGEMGRNSFGPGNLNKGREPLGLGRNRGDFGPRGDFDEDLDANRDTFPQGNMNRDNIGPRGRPDFEEENKSGFGGRPPFGRDFPGRNNFENSYDNEDYGDEREQFNDEPGYERDGRPPQNQRFGPGFRGGRDNFNGPPPPNFRGGRDDFSGPPQPNFRGGRDDFNEPPPPNFNNRNYFRKDDRSFHRGDDFGNLPNDRFDRYRDERQPPNRGQDGGRFDRGGDRFRGDFTDEYGQDNFADEGDYPPPPPIGDFGSRDNVDLMEDAPEPPPFSRDQFDEGHFDEMPPNDYVENQPEDDIWKPVTVIDYEHKRLKPPEIDILVQPLRMFDYRHKPLRRIPYPERPNWLSDTVKMIPEFDPPIIRPPTIDRRPYEDRYEPPPPRREDRYRMEERHKFERKPYDTRFSPPPPKFEENDWSSRRRRSRSPPPHRFERSPVDRVDRDRDIWDQGRSGERDRRGGNKRWEDEDRFRRDRSWERKDDRRDRRDDRDRREDRERRDDRDRGREEDGWKKRDTEWHDRERKWRNDDMEVDNGDRDRNEPQFKMENRNSERDTFNRKEGGGSVFPFSKPIDDNKPSNVTLIEDILNTPGRLTRPQRIVIILRGPPGSGKTHLAKMIKDKEVENGGSAPRILSLDDYFMVEQEKEVIEDGKRIKLKEMVYEFEAGMEESYRNSLIRSYKKTITDGYFPFIIVDNVNDKVKYFGEMWSFAKQNGFQVYITQLDLDIQNCTKRNVHNRTEEEILRCIEGWETTPSHHPILDATSLLQGEPISEVEMEEISSPISDCDDKDDGSEDQLDRSKWDNFDCSINNLARLDGVSKPPRPSRTMEEYLQLDDECEITRPTKPGQKRVRWADLEERKQQEKMRAIGFVVGQTDWDRMMDPTMGQGALTQTKYIESVQRKRF